MTTAKTNKPPVVILGGSSNALAVARSLGKHGVDIYLSVLERNCATFTRYAKKVFPIQDKKQVDAVWSDLLLRGSHPELHGSIIFPCNDDGLEFIARHRKELEAHYILDDSETDFVLA
ncbi:MAG: carboxylate--amine ligase, partial [Calditrichaeota bacterium]|nr:carboxylate--amine ligase [Calditrichota bacterium]